jgi:hypothetical protein
MTAGKLIGAGIALYVGIFGAFLAYLYFVIGWPLSIAAFVVPTALGALANCLGEARFWRSPKSAMRLKEAWVLFPASIAAAITALLIALNAQLDGWQVPGLLGAVTVDQNKEIITALSSAITAFLGAIILKAASDGDEDWIGPHVASAFREHYRRGKFDPRDKNNLYYDSSSYPLLDLAVYSANPRGDVEDWGFGARREREKDIDGQVREIIASPPSRGA